MVARPARSGTPTPQPGRRSAQTKTNSAAERAIAEYSAAIAAKLWSKEGSPEDHLRAPFEQLLRTAGKLFGLKVVALGEVRKPELAVRPDYAVDVGGARIGYVELKAPGKKVPGIWRPNKHDKKQWDKLSLLPNVLYSDGDYFAWCRSGEIVATARLGTSTLRSGRRPQSADAAVLRIIYNFLTWQPERPRTVQKLVRVVACLCKLLRDEVADTLEREQRGESSTRDFTTLAMEWRELLFPKLTDKEFCDAYAQTTIFALLLARVEGIDFTNRSVGEIALLLGKKHSLMGKALEVLTARTIERESIVVDTLIRVIGVVQWDDFPNDAYVHLYEDFITAYDPELRKQSGVYFTPQPVVAFMTRFVDDILRSRFGRSRGLADDDIIVVDPAMGSGSYLVEVIERVAHTIHTEEGPGQVGPRLRALSNRLIGFEKQAAPYAVAELRVHSTLRTTYGAEIPDEEWRFLSDTLDDPSIQEIKFGNLYEAIAKSRRGANRVKREVPVMVVIGNPPYRDKAKNVGVWIEAPGTDRVGRPSLDAFRAVGKGRWEYKLSTVYAYFWRWATWKAFDAHPEDPSGIIAFITPSSYLDGQGFAGMREYLRRTADEG